MPKKKEMDKKNNWLEDFELHHDAKKSVWAIIFISVAIILTMARFQNAGPAGNFFYNIFERLFGIGYYLLPLIFLIIAIVFLTSERQKLYKTVALGTIIFILSGLGIIDVIFPDKSGLAGYTIGLIEKLFGYNGSIVILTAALIASLIIILNFPIKKFFRKSETDEKKSAIKKEIKISEINNNINEEKNNLKEKENKEDDKEENFSIKNKLSDDVKTKQKKIIGLPKKIGDYIFPPLDLLKSSIEKPTVGDLRTSANIIKRTLESFGIPVEMGEINIGPKVTRFTLKPAEGVKLSKIIALNSDLSLALAAHPIRIEAPIPGKSLVGIEVPNKAAAVVRLGSLIHYPEFNESGLLGFILGRDVNGEPIVSNIEKMPHLLIAGSTGSGKSISLHSLLISLLYKNSPQTLKMILIDPKRVELSIYNGLPHLVSPVIIQSKKAIGVFRWAIEEMDKRYEILMNAGSRDIKSYNKKHPEDPLPFILIVVDELADLMSTYGREVEGAIVRLAQMARATGIHLILSTQRPSVEVITGLIKANITSRMALQVASQIDSRTILDSSGAEKLLGGGDMLFVSSESSKPKRIQGAYVSEEEIKKVAEFIRNNNKESVEKSDNDETSNFENNSNNANDDKNNIFDQYNNSSEEDKLLDEAIETVKSAGKASASLLQRRLKVGYARAARLLDIMEEKGIIGPGDGAKAREIYLEKLENSDSGH
ncbi:DNA translocase FtsK 4TM domain-containing protein [Candidatus Wolfebacteria bacterium]|nr:DNA translocase FtsK 4TM domain-containing protein [Candidatus Wolfebacteria bacterium]